jgi:hypothetical protein
MCDIRKWKVIAQKYEIFRELFMFMKYIMIKREIKPWLLQ